MALLTLLCALALQGPVAPPAAPSLPRLDAETFPAIVRAVVPSAGELEWRTIPWRSTLREGLADASAARKPLLLWAMNGHPLGTT